MDNPWRNLPLQPPFVLEIDVENIDRYNASKRSAETKINTNSIPEPFIGNPDLAKLVLLNLNPGDAEGDREAHSNPDFRTAMIHNLRHERQEFPFYALNPAFKQTPCAVWWRPRTRELQEAASLDDATFAQRLFVIEWFPYHSKKSGLPSKTVCESQRYSFQLVRKMLEKKKLIVRMRSEKHWTASDPAFGGVRRLKNPQCGYISMGNTEGNLFERMVEALNSP